MRKTGAKEDEHPLTRFTNISCICCTFVDEKQIKSKTIRKKNSLAKVSLQVN